MTSRPARRPMGTTEMLQAGSTNQRAPMRDISVSDRSKTRPRRIGRRKSLILVGTAKALKYSGMTMCPYKL